MSNYKKYTDADAKLHLIVKALKDKGHTSILVEWNGAMSRNRGWTISSDQLPHRRFNQEVTVIVKIINRDFEKVHIPGDMKPRWRDLKFKTDKEAINWLDKTKYKSITFVDNGQDLLNIWIDDMGEILSANLQQAVWIGKFVSLSSIKAGVPIEMYFSDEKKWITMDFITEEVITHTPS